MNLNVIAKTHHRILQAAQMSGLPEQPGWNRTSQNRQTPKVSSGLKYERQWQTLYGIGSILNGSWVKQLRQKKIPSLCLSLGSIITYSFSVTTLTFPLTDSIYCQSSTSDKMSSFFDRWENLCSFIRGSSLGKYQATRITGNCRDAMDAIAMILACPHLFSPWRSWIWSPEV